MKAPSPLLGFNNNVRHKGRVFHIQTEDSGIRHPHIITHLFADGGRILKTTKTSYAEHIGQDRLAETVRTMMQEQHKAMFIALRDGQFDYLFDEGGPQSIKSGVQEAAATKPKLPVEAPGDGSAAPPAEAAPATAEAAPPAPTATIAGAPTMPTMPATVVVPPPRAPDESVPPASSRAPGAASGPTPRAPAEPSIPAAAASGPVPRAPAEPKPSSTVGAPAPPVIIPKPQTPAPPRISLPRPGPQLAPTEPAQPAVNVAPGPLVPTEPSTPVVAYAPDAGVTPASRRRGASRPTLDVDPGAIHGMSSGGEPSIDLDLDALERAAAEAQTPFFQQIQDLPPPPAAVLGSKRASTGGYSVRTPGPGQVGRSPEGSLGAPARGPNPPVPPIAAPSPGRYAPSRPASIFATTRPQEGASIFGEDLISEKSLDEVILSYLAEDLDGPVEKK